MLKLYYEEYTYIIDNIDGRQKAKWLYIYRKTLL